MSSQGAFPLHGDRVNSTVLSFNHEFLTRERMAGGDIWMQWFTCCVTQQPPPVSPLKYIYFSNIRTV